MDTRFAPNNLHHEDVQLFRKVDPQLKRLAKLRYVYRSPLIDEIPKEAPGVYTICGGRQVGKTTMLKQWMLALMEAGVSPGSIFFLSGELIDDHHQLIRLAQECVGEASAGKSFLIIDEVTYIREWDKGVKYLVDTGVFDETELMLSGSDTTMIKEARMRFPGRRGKADVVDFLLWPLDFPEVLLVKHSLNLEGFQIEGDGMPDPGEVQVVFEEFENYLIHGGYLTAINDMAQAGGVLPATLATYSDWIRGDFVKRGKSENILRELLSGIVTQYGSQMTMHSLMGATSVSHHATIGSYVELLGSMEVVLVINALVEDKLRPAPKKARKLHFVDPFIFHSVRHWLEPTAAPHDTAVSLARDPNWGGRLAESVVMSYCARRNPTYYIKGDGEVDVAYVKNGKFHPVEVKWSRQIRPNELKQVLKYPNGIVLTKSPTSSAIDRTRILPLPLALACGMLR